MMKSDWSRVQGDAEDTLTARFDGVVDLLGVASVEAHVWKYGVAPTTLTAQVIDPVACTVRVLLSPWLNIAEPGIWNLEIQATWTGSPALKITSPEDKPATIEVRKQGA